MTIEKEAADTDEVWNRRPWWRRTAPFMSVFVVLGLALPIFSFTVMMVDLGWRAPVLGGGSISAPSADAPVFLYASPQTARFLRDNGGDYELLLKPWRGYFADRNREYSEIADLSRLRAEPGSVLVLPSALALSDLERNRLTKFQAEGGGILTTWATGSRDGSGEWRGWDFLQAMGFYVLGEIPAESQERQMTVLGETPLSVSLQPGQRMWMTNTSEPLLRIKGEMIAARFTNWQRDSTEGRGEEGAILYSERANSRVAAFAFAESTWAASPVATHGLIDDTLAWLQRRPTMALANWPEGRLAAQVVEMDTEEGFADARVFSAMLAQAQLPATFFVLTSSAVQHPEVYRELAMRHEIAYHGDLHVSFEGQSTPEQERRMAAMRAQLESLGATREPILGFRAPTEGYDATTERLLQRNGLRYHAADPDRGDGQLPFFVKMDGVVGEDELLILPRTQRDDINLLDAVRPPTGEGVLRAMVKDLDENIRVGGLGLLSVHSQNFGEGEALKSAMPGYLAELGAQRRAGRVWVAQAGEIDAWWRERRRVSVAGTLRGPRIELNITVKGDRPVRGATVIVMLPSRAAKAVARGSKVGTAQPRVVSTDPFRSQFVFDELAPGNYSYQVNFSDASP